MKKFNLIKKASLLTVACTSFAPIITLTTSCSNNNSISPKNVDGSNWLGVIDGKFASDDYVVDHFTKTITYISAINIWTENLVVPNFVIYNRQIYKVDIGEHCFEKSQYITGTVEFNDFANSVPNFCFNGSKYVTNLIMHTPPLVIGDYAFSKCSSFKGILIRYLSTLDDNWWMNIMSIGLYAFQHTLISGVFLAPKSLTNISAGAFSECGLLEDINLKYATSLPSIEDEVFLGCYTITQLSLPASIKKIGKRSFAYCSSLTKAYITTATMSIELGSEAFSGCTAFLGFSRPIQITKCGSYCFLGCDLFHQDLWNCVVDKEESWCGGMEEIGISCFAATYFLSVKFASPQNGGPSDIRDYAFAGCTGIQSIDVTDFTTLPNWTGVDIFDDVGVTGVIRVRRGIFKTDDVRKEWESKFISWGIEFDDPYKHNKWKFIEEDV